MKPLLAVSLVWAVMFAAPAEVRHATTSVAVIVEDTDGKPVAGLNRDDFELWSEGQRLPVESFSSAAAMGPLTVVVLVDVTSSQIQCPDVKVLPEIAMSDAGRGSPRTSSIGLLGVWGQFKIQGFGQGDRVRVGSIGRRLSMSEAFTGDETQIRKDWQALFDVPPVEGLGPSPIWDGLDETIALLAHEPGHRAVVLISDGQASGNVHGHDEVAMHAAIAGVSVSVVAQESMLPATPMQTMASHGVDPAAALLNIAEFSGGGFEFDRAKFQPYDPCFERDPALHFKRALDKLHQAYILGFQSQVADGNPHPLEVRTTMPGLVVKARKVY